MRRVQIISPFRADTPADRRANVAYAQAAMLDCLTRGEAPFAPHLIYPSVLDDSDPVQRAQGMEAGMEWMTAVDAVVVYTDRGVSAGMADEIRHAERLGVPVERRVLAGWVRTDPVCSHGVGRAYPCLLCKTATTATQELPVVTVDAAK
jgi:hypothetical protein